MTRLAPPAAIQPDAGGGALPAELQARFAVQQQAFAGDGFPSGAARLDRLERLRRLVEENEDRFAQAISADFGHRAREETLIAEVFFVLAGLAHARKHLGRWMKPRRVATSFHSLPGSSSIVPQPLGVIGIVSPWNYPLQLALAPAVAALAAGNRVMIKPSELTPRFSELLAHSIAAAFAADECTVITGDADTGRAFVRLPFNHLFFTGSTAVGRQVGLAAAANLTPVTLELGGKSPAILDHSCDLPDSARKIAAGKLFNAGQTCIAPDYVLVPAAQQQAFVDAFTLAVGELYPTLERNPDYTSIVNQRHYSRLEGLADDARRAGARVIEINPGGEAQEPGSRKMRPKLVLQVTGEMSVMREEIFGPLLPVIGYEQLGDALAFVNARPRPLALYWFGRDAAREEQVLRDSISGGVTVNDVLLHIAQENLPFGGVGDSGIGAYHGEYGFRLFSKEKPVFRQSRFGGTALTRPPYGQRSAWVIAALKRLV
ncbi:coniferyl aldehyde dehydrogenase [Ramlibacter sp.]|uniref:coniferyl aldehyde dehydrogenase n=1 Tax=Ramlibacter sp. TaxID=1917967 RepID=UPI002BF697F0|nr:coniferyl aldehyde dehydrogenase [Ramlibacter sp.]HWI81708.1 coniferyl aldehyde dehydrogenase [Ramlibacter sp.]